VFFSGFNLDDSVEIRFCIDSPLFNFSLNNFIVRSIDVIIHRRFDSANLEWCKKSVIDALLERVDIHRLSEIFVGIHIIFSSWSRCEPELYGGSKIFEKPSPIPLIVRSSAMTFVYNDEIEEIGRILPKVGRIILSTHERLEDCEENTSIGWNCSLFANICWIDTVC
jgi:hypothetical protein